MGDGASCSVMIGAGETYLPAFALAAGLGEVASGLVSTVPLLVGSLLQLIAPYGVRWRGSHRRWIILCVACQAMSFLPLAVGAAMGWVPGALVFLAAAMYWGSGLASSPSWNTWMGSVVPRRIRAQYFARRTRLGHAGTLMGFAGAGLSLHVGAAYGQVLDVFAVVFLAASMFRFVSAVCLWSQEEPAVTAGNRTVSLRDWWRRLREGTDGSLLLYFLAVQCAAQISGPYFNPYMLKHLNFTYAQFVVLVAGALVGRIAALPLLGGVAKRYGARTLLWIGGVGIAPMSVAWVVSESFLYLVALQVLVGVLWAAYELAVALSFFEAIAEEERTSILTKYNVAHATATVAGSLMGGFALVQFGKTPGVYMSLFALSTVARFAALWLLWRVPKENNDRQPVTLRVRDVIEHADAQADRTLAA
jgi:MFS family permease